MNRPAPLHGPSRKRHAGSVAPDDVARALRELPAWSGVTGSFRFDAQGAAIGQRAMMTTVQGGRFVYLDPRSAGAAIP